MLNLGILTDLSRQNKLVGRHRDRHPFFQYGGDYDKMNV